MIYLIIISVVLVLAAYWFTKRADQLLLEDLSSAYKHMELALITGFLAYISLAGSAILIYMAK